MKGLVTGAGGQVGSEIVRLHAPDFNVVGLDRQALDINKRDQLAAWLDAVAPDIVVNCAAHTAVDRAEDEPQLAYAVNADSVGILGEECAARRIGVFHLSTDYVFDGAKGAAYVEEDSPNPLGVYGASKLAGEKALQAATTRCLILRVSWVFGRLGRSFVDTILALARDRRDLAVVADQVGAPSPATGVAHTVRDVAKAIMGRSDRWDIYHYSTAPPLSWCGFAREIVRVGKESGLLNEVPTIRAISTSEWPTKAARPLDSRLNATKLCRVFGVGVQPWAPAMQEYIHSLGQRSTSSAFHED